MRNQIRKCVIGWFYAFFHPSNCDKFSLTLSIRFPTRKLEEMRALSSYKFFVSKFQIRYTLVRGLYRDNLTHIDSKSSLGGNVFILIVTRIY